MITVTQKQVDDIASKFDVTDLQIIAAAQNAEQYATTDEEWLTMFVNGLDAYEDGNK